MSKGRRKKQQLQQEKLFKNTTPRSRVQLDLVKRLKLALKNMPADLPAKIISYQDIIREDGEYYLVYQGSNKLKPLVEYLYKNSISAQKLLQEFKQVLELVEDLQLIKEIFPNGLNAGNFYIDEKENIFLMPEELLKAKKNYDQFYSEIPTEEYFKPPEIIQGECWQQNSYIFNTAAVFYYFFSFETIFSDQEKAKLLNKIKSEKILELKFLLPEINDQLNSLFKQMLARKKSQRPTLDSAIKNLKKAAAANNFELKPFLQREKNEDKKIVQKKRRKEKIKLFFRQSWKPLLFFVILFTSLIWGLSSGPAPVITAENSPEEVANYFYKALAAKNIALADEAAEFDLGQLNRLISESHVIEKMQMAYQGPSQDKKVNQVYSLENLRLEKKTESENRHVFKTFYEFNFRDSEKLYSHQLKDTLIVEKVDEIWRIKEIKGDLAEMIAGKYPWREK